MKKMTHKHIEAIGHGKLFLNKAFATNPEPRFKLAIEKDMVLMDEVRSFLLKTMYDPTFQYEPEKLPAETKDLHKDNHDGPANASS